MRRQSAVSWCVVAAAALALMGCSERETENDEDEGLTAPTAAQTPVPAATPTPEPSSAPASPAPTPSPTAAPAAVAYVQDIKPILDADCARCHSSFGTYAGALRYVQPGSAASPLVVVTQPGGAMYGYLRGDASGKSSLIRRWVVENGAAQTR
jgi:hypothetical protein